MAPDMLEYVLLGLQWVAPLLALYLLYELAMKTVAFIQTQYVSGDPNEWVIIIRDGEQR